MSIFNKIKNRLVGSLKKNLSLAIYSIIIAVIAWFVISLTVYPSMSKTILNIPIDTDISGTAAAESGLSLISCDVESVDVKIRANRSQIGNISNENLRAVIKAGNISTTGVKTLSIDVLSEDNKVQFEIESIYPKEATVVFDKYETREFRIKPEIPNITFAEGKSLNDDEFNCDPETISITGPAAQLDKISECIAVSNKEIKLDTTYSVVNDEIKLFTENGALIEQSAFKFNTTSFLIYVPVLTQKTVGLSVGIANAPPNFNKDCLNFKFSVDSLTIASKSGNLSDIPDTIEIGKINLSELDINYSRTFNIDLNDYINISNVDTVTVTLDNENLSEKKLVVDKFEISNPPSDYDFSVLTKRLDITVVGPADIIENITSNDIVADVNLLNASANITQGDSFTHDVTISCSNYDNVWIATQAKVIIQKEAKQDDQISSPSAY